jgi:hypothetical protein
LRFINDHNRARSLNKLHGLSAGEFVALLVNDIALLFGLGASKVFPKSVNVDDKDLQRVAGCKLP